MNHYQYDNSPPNHNAAYDTQPVDDIERDTKMLIDAFLPHGMPVPGLVPHAAYSLPHPLCLPQISTAFDSPFSRGYSPALQGLGITQQAFLGFIDGLNMAMIASPPLQIVNMVGSVIGMVPHWPFAVAATVLQTGAQVGMHVASKSLSDRFLRASDEKLFAPAGLRVRLCKTPALRVLVGLQAADTPGLSKLDKFGRGVGEVVLHLPLPIPFLKRGVRALMDKPPPVDPCITDPVVRCLMLLEGHALPVDFNVPPPIPPQGALDKVSAYSVKKRQGKVDSKANLTTARRQILAGLPVTVGSNHDGFPSSAATSSSTTSDRDQRKLARKIKKMERKVARGRDRKLRRKVEMDDLAEYHQNEKLVWLVIVNEEQDKLIRGVERVDDPSNEVMFNDAEVERSKGAYDEDLSSDSEESFGDDGRQGGVERASGRGKYHYP